MATQAKLYNVLSGLFSNDKLLKKIITKQPYTNPKSIDERLTELSGLVNDNELKKYKGIVPVQNSNGLTVEEIVSQQQKISIAKAGALTFGTIKSSDQATIENGQITSIAKQNEAGKADSADKVKESLSIFGKSYNGSLPIAVKLGNYLSIDTADKLNVVADGKCISSNSGLVSGGLLNQKVQDLIGTNVSGQDTIKSARVEAASAQTKADNAYNALGKYTGANSVETEMSSILESITNLTNYVGTFPVEENINTVIQYVNNKISKVKGDIQGAALGIISGDGIKLTPSTVDGKAYTKIDVVVDGKTLSCYGNGLSIKSEIKLVKLVNDASSEWAASYQLQDKDGTQIGDQINIPKDQFLKNVEYDSSLKRLNLTFSITNSKGEQKPVTTFVDVSDLVDTYEGGNGIKLANNSFSIESDGLNDSKYLNIGNDSIGLSGITEDMTASKINAEKESIGAETDQELENWKKDFETMGSLAYLEDQIKRFNLDLQ